MFKGLGVQGFGCLRVQGLGRLTIRVFKVRVFKGSDV